MRIIRLALILLLSCVGASAQADYLTSVKVFVRDSQNKSIEKVDFQVRLLPAERWEPQNHVNVIRMDDSSVVHLGLEARGTFLIRVDANGYEPFEFKVFFDRGHMQTVAVKLKRAGTAEPAGVEWFTTILGRVFDPTGSAVVGAKVTATGKLGPRFETTTDKEGLYILELPYEPFFWDSKDKKWDRDVSQAVRYDLEVKAAGFRPFAINKFALVNGLRGSLQFDIILNPGARSPGGADVIKN